MNKAFYTVLIILLSCSVYAQENNYTITYDVIYTLGRSATSQDKLYISTKDNKSIYIKGESSYEKMEEEQKPGHIVIDVKTPYTEVFYYFNYNSNNLYSRVQPWLKTYFIKEPTPEMNWQLHDESKTNSENVILHKATISFRGRDYTAWYSTEYPIQGGPWKFNNLPGLAFEIIEENNQYHWQLTKIEQNKFKVLPMRYDISRANETLMSYLKNYQIEVESYDNGFGRIANNIPGLDIIETVTDKDGFKRFRHSDLERKYEWEE